MGNVVVVVVVVAIFVTSKNYNKDFHIYYWEKTYPIYFSRTFDFQNCNIIKITVGIYTVNRYLLESLSTNC